mmetsp:Transcript_36447/g.104161  ORF Transcript_36447/g.104161 Transcript_36447/m.104161 type:complete len:203 (-) Transcript_36447:757-1365(-)
MLVTTEETTDPTCVPLLQAAMGPECATRDAGARTRAKQLPCLCGASCLDTLRALRCLAKVRALRCLASDGIHLEACTGCDSAPPRSFFSGTAEDSSPERSPLSKAPDSRPARRAGACRGGSRAGAAKARGSAVAASSASMQARRCVAMALDLCPKSRDSRTLSSTWSADWLPKTWSRDTSADVVVASATIAPVSANAWTAGP